MDSSAYAAVQNLRHDHPKELYRLASFDDIEGDRIAIPIERAAEPEIPGRYCLVQVREAVQLIVVTGKSLEYTGIVGIGDQNTAGIPPVRIANHLKKAEVKEKIIASKGKAKFRAMIEHLVDEDKILKTNETLIPNFLENSIQRVKKSQLLNLV